MVAEMNNIKVSVIVPVYNSSKYICQTLNSIINQDFTDYEIIVIDDGSTDNSLDIAFEELSKSTIPHKIIHQKNSGVSIARNHGIEVSRGDYIVFVDSDDLISKNHLSELYNGKSDFSIIQLVKKDGDKLSSHHNYTEKLISCEEFIEMELEMKIPFNFCQLTYKSSIIRANNLKFNPEIIYGEDTDFALRALSYGENIAISNEVTYFYIQHSGSSVSTSKLKRFEFINVLEDLSEFYKKNNKDNLARLVTTSRIPKAIFGNMNYFFYNSYDYDDVINKMNELDLFSKLSKYEGDVKFRFKIKLFLFNPKLYYILWKKFKNSI